MKIHFCIATKENAVNILPLEMEQLQADLIYVATTRGMKAQGESLIEEFKSTGKKAEYLHIEQESSLRALVQQYENWLFSHENDDIIVNLTGGTKLMSIAAYQVFSGYGIRCFYQDKDSNQIYWLDDESVISDLGSKIGLQRYLKSYHSDIVKKHTLADIPKSYRDYGNLLFAELSKAGKYDATCRLISKLNAHAAKPKLTDLTHFQLTHEEEAFLEHLSHETALFKLTGQSIAWQTEQDRAFVAGGWLEWLTADLLRGGDFRDISLSVEIAQNTQRSRAMTNQEIDVMAMQQQKLVMIECKTKNWKTATEASEAIYKLSALSNLGGLNTKPIFVSLYALPETAKTRAAEHGIQILAGQAAITQLKNRLINI